MTRRVAFQSGANPRIVEISTRLEPALKRIFPDYQVPASDEAAAWSAVHTAGGWAIRGGEHEFRIESDEEAFGVLERKIADQLALDLGPTLLLHAGGAVLSGGAILVAGPSGSGKSSLLAALAREGVDVLGDDAVPLFAVDGGFEARPFRRLFKLHEGARRRLGLAEPGQSTRGLLDDPVLLHPRTIGAQWARPARVSHVVLASRDERETALRTLPASLALRRLLTSVLRPADRSDAFDQLAEVAASVTFSQLRFVHCDDGAAALATLR